MDLLITLLRAAHCRSTHHFFAVDALHHLNTAKGYALGTVLLGEHAQYLTGAKDPDKKFRDFRNHVVHVADGHWGGATKAARRWYGTLIEALDENRWSDAAYAAGVLSHYYTDPLMPLHTAQSKRESVVHRPLEWSVTKSYERILQCWRTDGHRIVFELSNQDDWLEQAIHAGAELAHQYYDELIDDYDLKVGCKRPTEGFNARAIDTLAGLFGVAITGWAKILERAASETKANIPEQPLSAAAFVAGLKMPAAWVTKRIESASERRAVQALFDEYSRTGKVKKNLPEEVKSVRRARRKDRDAERQRDNPHQASRDIATTVMPEPPRAPTNQTEPATETVPIRKPIEKRAQGSELDPAPIQQTVSAPQPERSPSASLAPTDDLVDAPSIGPKTAKRFAKIGITTVAQFLDASPEEMAEQLDTRWINEELLVDWQDQARLVCDVPSLCGYKAQLLVGVECRDAASLASERAKPLHKKIKAFAQTSEGKRALRSSRVPSKEDIAQWIDDAVSQIDLRKSA